MGDRDPIRAPALSELETFVLSVDYGSIARAAEVVHISAAAAAKRIRQLEMIAGGKLLSRSGRGVRPTELGLRLYPESRQLLEQRDRLLALLGGAPVGEGSRIPGIRRVLRHLEAPRPEYIIQQTEALLSAIFHASGEAILLIRARDGLICEVNEAGAALTGYDAEELRGRRAAELPLWRDLDHDGTLLARAEADRGPRIAAVALVSSDGDELHVGTRLQVIKLHGERYVLLTVREPLRRLADTASQA